MGKYLGERELKRDSNGNPLKKTSFPKNTKPSFSSSLSSALNKVYVCEVSRQDHLVRKDGGDYDAVEYEEHPEKYISVFAHKVGGQPGVFFSVF